MSHKTDDVIYTTMDSTVLLMLSDGLETCQELSLISKWEDCVRLVHCLRAIPRTEYQRNSETIQI